MGRGRAPGSTEQGHLHSPRTVARKRFPALDLKRVEVRRQKRKRRMRSRKEQQAEGTASARPRKQGPLGRPPEWLKHKERGKGNKNREAAGSHYTDLVKSY